MGRKARKAAEELRMLRSLRRESGLRFALAARARWHLDLASIPGRVAYLEGAAASAERRIAALEERSVLHEFRETHAEDRLAEAERTLDGVARLSRMLDAIEGTTALVAELPPSDLLVTVIIPTYNRTGELARAIASVQAQAHQAWELIVVDDASDAPTGELLASIGDPRVIGVRRPANEGAAAARNLGLERARGAVIVYLDDDNVMRPLWLRAVAWAFETHPEAQVAYGARAMEFVGEPYPWVQLDPWDRNRMQTRCLIDQNVIAHRAGLPEAYMEPDVETGSDWDLALRLTEDRDPVCVPVVAVVYHTTAGDRLSDATRAHGDWVGVQRRALRRRPLRILVADLGAASLDPARADAEAAELRRQGAVVAWWREAAGGQRLEAAAEELDPRVVAVHGDAITGPQLARLERLGRPFYLRRRGTPGPLDDLDRALGHPLCIGVLGAPGDGFLDDELLPALDRVRARIAGFDFEAEPASAPGARSDER